ncbi:hypothetical protein KBC03_07175 [Patescibacteria group bacterium]|nr:hypothetical protein [Patescibacteria group bacterium]
MTTYGLTFMRVLPLSFLIYLLYGLIVSFVGLRRHSFVRSNWLAY